MFSKKEIILSTTKTKMKIKIKVHPNSSQEKIEKISENEYHIWLHEKPTDGKANTSLVNILKKYFKKNIEIKSGFTSRIKYVELVE